MDFFAPGLKQIVIVGRGVATEKFSGGHLKIGGAQRGYFRNFGRFYSFLYHFPKLMSIF